MEIPPLKNRKQENPTAKPKNSKILQIATPEENLIAALGDSTDNLEDPNNPSNFFELLEDILIP